MGMLLAAMPGGTTALALSGVMALITIATGRSLLREEVASGSESHH